MEVGRKMSALFGNHNHKETELSLALPGESKVTGKRALSETVDLISKLRSDESDFKSENSVPQSDPPAAKALVVGWPPVRFSRKNTMVNQKNSSSGELEKTTFVKVSIDGVAILRKVDLKSYQSYCELWDALAKMFSSFNMGNYGAGTQEVGMIDFMDEGNKNKLMDLNNSNNSKYVATYQDKDGDWMLVGDVPWEMFVDSCKRLRIIKSSDATGLGAGGKSSC